MKKLDAVLPCRVTGTRLYGKPLQLIDIEERVTILENLVKYLSSTNILNRICLAISEEEENYGFVRLAKKYNWEYVFGDPLDVLGRVIKAIDHIKAENVLFASTENPFLYVKNLRNLYVEHLDKDYDYSMESDLPDGAAVSILRSESLRISHRDGEDRHRSELVTSYIFDNRNRFKINLKEPEKGFKRSDIRLTVDYPEDLVFCREIYYRLRGRDRLIPMDEIITYWDMNTESRKQVEQIGVDWGHGRLWE